MKKVLLIFLLLINFINAQDNSFGIKQSEDVSGNFNNMIMVEGVFKRNFGEFGEVWKKAYGFNLGYGFYKAENLLIIINSGLSIFKVKEGKLYDDSSLLLVPIHLGARYTFKLNNIIPYFLFTNGINLIFQNTDLEGKRNNKTLVKYHWQVGMGTMAMLTRNLGLDFNLNYINSFYKLEAMMTGIEYRFGFVCGF